jgi:hypothetical protein
MKDRKQGTASLRKIPGKLGNTAQNKTIKGKSVDSKLPISKVIPKFKLLNDRARKTLASGRGGMIGGGAVVKPYTVRLPKANDSASKEGMFKRKVRLDSRNGPVVTTIVEKHETWNSSTSIKIGNSSSHEKRSPRETERVTRKENFEIHINNDRAAPTMDSGRTYEPVEQASFYQRNPIPVQAQAHILPAPIAATGISSASSAFRTPMAVMDMYTGRYGRPAMEPYRPPPAVQQFYNALSSNNASSTMLNASHLGANPQITQQRSTFSPAQSFNVLSDRFSDNPGQIRKPYE